MSYPNFYYVVTSSWLNWSWYVHRMKNYRSLDIKINYFYQVFETVFQSSWIQFGGHLINPRAILSFLLLHKDTWFLIVKLQVRRGHYSLQLFFSSYFCIYLFFLGLLVWEDNLLSATQSPFTSTLGLSEELEGKIALGNWSMVPRHDGCANW